MSYNKHDNIVDLASAAFIDVMLYLEKQGVPKPDDVDVKEVGIPTGLRYTNKTLIWRNTNPDPFEIDAYLVMNFPSFAVRMYRGWAGLPPATIPEYEPPKPPVPEPGKPEKYKLANEGVPGYVRRTNGLWTWWEKA